MTLMLIFTLFIVHIYGRKPNHIKTVQKEYKEEYDRFIEDRFDWPKFYQGLADFMAQPVSYILADFFCFFEQFCDDKKNHHPECANYGHAENLENNRKFGKSYKLWL